MSETFVIGPPGRELFRIDGRRAFRVADDLTLDEAKQVIGMLATQVDVNHRLAALEAVRTAGDVVMERALDIASCVLDGDQSLYEERIITRDTAHLLKSQVDAYRAATAALDGEGSC